MSHLFATYPLLSTLALWACVGLLIATLMCVTGIPFSRKHPDRLKTVNMGRLSLRSLFVIMFLWPPLVLLIARALKNKRHPLEQIQVEIEAQRAAQNQARSEKVQTAIKQFASELPLSTKWSTPPDKPEVSIRADLYLDHVNKCVTVYPTHTVTKFLDGFLSFRLLASPEDLLKPPHLQLFGCHKSIEDARALCEQDTEWISLGSPLKEEARKEFWAQSPDNFDPNTMSYEDFERIVIEKSHRLQGNC